MRNVRARNANNVNYPAERCGSTSTLLPACLPANMAAVCWKTLNTHVEYIYASELSLSGGQEKCVVGDRELRCKGEVLIAYEMNARAILGLASVILG